MLPSVRINLYYVVRMGAVTARGKYQLQCCLGRIKCRKKNEIEYHARPRRTSATAPLRTGADTQQYMSGAGGVGVAPIALSPGPGRAAGIGAWRGRSSWNDAAEGHAPMLWETHLECCGELSNHRQAFRLSMRSIPRGVMARL